MDETQAQPQESSPTAEFQFRVSNLEQLASHPEVQRQRPAALIYEWLPLLGSIGVDRAHVANLVRGVHMGKIDSSGRLMGRFVDAFYIVKDQESSEDALLGDRGLWVEAMLSAEDRLRRNASGSVSSRLSGCGLTTVWTGEGYELRDVREDATALEMAEMIDEVEEGWMLVERSYLC